MPKAFANGIIQFWIKDSIARFEVFGEVLRKINKLQWQRKNDLRVVADSGGDLPLDT